MKGKKKLPSQPPNKTGLASSSGSDLSDSSGTIALRRVSERVKRKSNSSGTVKQRKSPALADSAYDGDEESTESTTGASSPEKIVSVVDPYGLDNMEDVPIVSKLKVKTKKNIRALNKKSSSHVQIPTSTSTPVLGINRQMKRRSFKGDGGTPEVTPILPVHSPSAKFSRSDGSSITPYNRRSCRKRPHPGESDTPVLETNLLNYSSQGDSGIVVTPSPKKQFTLSAGKDFNSKTNKVKKRQQTTNVNKAKNSENQISSFMTSTGTSYRKRKVLSTVHQVDNFESKTSHVVSPRTNKEDHCFGFTISPVPTTPPSSRKNKIKSSKPRKMFSPVNNKDYRVSKELMLSDSAGDSMLKGDNVKSSDSQSPAVSPCGNLIPSRGSSPPLFSDDIFSIEADSLEVNKSTFKPYKASKLKRTSSTKQPKKELTKVDEWYSNFNMEIADIEKFELNIE